MVDLHAGGQVLELLVGIERAPSTHDCRASVVSIYIGRLTLHLECKESSVGDVRLDLENAGGGAREGVGSYFLYYRDQKIVGRPEEHGVQLPIVPTVAEYVPAGQREHFESDAVFV